MRVFKSAVAHSVNADKQRSFKDRCVTDPTMFRVMSVMTTSIRFHIKILLLSAKIIIINSKAFVKVILIKMGGKFSG